MARDWEGTFSDWTEPASGAEEERYERTRKRIDKALRQDGRLSQHDFEVYPKGSYPNYTNVVADSDVDIAVELTELYGWRMTHDAKSEGLTLEDVGGSYYHGDYELAPFKDQVESALQAEFGSAVSRGKKAIHIAEGQGGLAADVVPCKTHKSWTSRHATPQVGIQLRNDANPTEEILNYPAQHLIRGREKNRFAGKRFKRAVRILKRLENEMVKKKVIEVVPSFLIESAVYNVETGKFTNATSWVGLIQSVLAHVFNETRTNDCVASEDWMEVNDIKYLFHRTQFWSYRDINHFADQAWDYVGY